METAIGVLPQVVLNCSEKKCFTEIIPLLTVSMGQWVISKVYRLKKRMNGPNQDQRFPTKTALVHCKSLQPVAIAPKIKDLDINLSSTSLTLHISDENNDIFRIY